MLALAHPSVLPSALRKASALGVCFFRGSMAGLCVPLPTLRPCPYGQRRTARGRCGSLLLHRGGLAPPTPRRSPGAREAKQSRAVGTARASLDCFVASLLAMTSCSTPSE